MYNKAINGLVVINRGKKKKQQATKKKIRRKT